MYYVATFDGKKHSLWLFKTLPEARKLAKDASTMTGFPATIFDTNLDVVEVIQ